MTARGLTMPKRSSDASHSSPFEISDVARPKTVMLPASGRLAPVIRLTSSSVAAASTLDKDLKGSLPKGSDLAAAQAVGKLLAERALKAGVKDVVFDRGGYIYHGRVKALAEAAREAGLNF